MISRFFLKRIEEYFDRLYLSSPIGTCSNSFRGLPMDRGTNFFFCFINVSVRTSLRVPRLIPRALRLTTM